MSGAGHSPEHSPLAELRSEFLSTAGGVMTEEAGAITGDLELLTRPTPDGDSIEAYVRYAGAQDLYTVLGSLVRAVSDYLRCRRTSAGARAHSGGPNDASSWRGRAWQRDAYRCPGRIKVSAADGAKKARLRRNRPVRVVLVLTTILAIVMVVFLAANAIFTWSLERRSEDVIGSRLGSPTDVDLSGFPVAPRLLFYGRSQTWERDIQSQKAGPWAPRSRRSSAFRASQKLTVSSIRPSCCPVNSSTRLIL